MAAHEFDCEVLIAGAGPVGASLALALERAGVDLRIVDQAEGLSGESRAITIQPRILEQLHLLDAADPLVSAGVRAPVMHMHVGTKRVTTLRYDRLPTRFPFYLHLHQGETERRLTGLLGERGVEVERGLALREFNVLPGDAGVEVELRTRTGELRRIRCRYLVGCDGGHSRTRKLLQVEFSGERHGDNWIMADLRIPNFDLAPDERHGFMLENYPFVILPMADGYFRVIAGRPPNSPLRGEDPTLEEFTAIARSLGFTWNFEDPLWLTNYNPSQFIASKFRRGPVFLAGDAAHVNTPIGAQGLNTGVMDAVNLGWKLAWALRHGGGEGLLDSYHDERHPVVLAMFRANDRLTRMVFGENPVIRGLARRQLRLLEIPGLNLRNTGGSAQLTVGYRASPAVLAARGRLGRALAPGDRAPCVELEGTQRLYDLLDGGRHTLVIVDDARGAGLKWAEELMKAESSWLNVLYVGPARGQGESRVRYIRDPSGRVARAFGLGGGEGVLLRPDAFVGARVGLWDWEVVSRYLRVLRGG